MNKTNLNKGVVLNQNIATYKSALKLEENRVVLLVESFDEQLDVDVKVRGVKAIWVLSSADILPIYRAKVEVLKERIKNLESEFKKL